MKLSCAQVRRMLQVMASSLSSSMLMALEVAVEYWLALSWSPQAQWLAESETSSVLQHEVRAIWEDNQSSAVSPVSIPALIGHD